MKNEIHKTNNNDFKNFIRNLVYIERYINYLLWKSTKRPKRPVIPISPIQQDGSWTKSIKDQVETLVDYLQDLFTNRLHTFPSNNDSILLNQKAVKIFAIIKDLKNKLLEELPEKALRFLTILTNAIFRISQSLQIGKCAEIISLVPIISKVIQKPLVNK
ncbi:hypothetical protein WH47_10549 [Habropoda laboriosa]|uniref:Uncharacterized protein n=1 Tax=Habropoda laboriosa TaxID=597456 RepID=A0A0L7QMQ4_9HYME|nr:hypothetical protein WH47_10549 [Habropoda laboriosa]